MGTTNIPYSRIERRKAYFVLHLDKEVKVKRSLFEVLTFKKAKTALNRVYCIFNKDKTKFNFVDDINKAHIFKFDTAVELGKKIGNPEIKVSMVKGSPNGIILI